MNVSRPLDYIIRAIQDFKKNNPRTPFLQVSELAELLKMNKDELARVLVEMSNAKMVVLHPSWPRKEAIFIPAT